MAAGPEVVVLPTTGIVDEGMARYLEDGIARAEQRRSGGRRHQAQYPGRQPLRHE